MSIVQLKRVTICGLTKEKSQALEKLQWLGCLHLIPLQPKQTPADDEKPAELEDTNKALRWLMDVRNKRRQVLQKENFNLAQILVEVLQNKDHIRDAENYRDALLERKKNLELWGDFKFAALEELAKHRLWFCIIPQSDMHHMKTIGYPWQVVHQDNRFVYVTVISREEPLADKLPVPRTHIGSNAISDIKRYLNQVEVELEELYAKRQSLTKWIYLISRHIAWAEDQSSLKQAQEGCLQIETIFVVQGWLAVSNIASVENFATQNGLAIIIQDPQSNENPPTLLANPAFVAGGEDLVSFYQMPAYGTWDPSKLLFFSFAIFFSMILSDAGYALVLALLQILLWRRMGRSPRLVRLRSLFVVLIVGSFVWGTLVGSWFGQSFAESSLLGSMQLMSINDFDSMMQLSIGIGVLHLIIANAIMARQRWGHSSAFVPIGWISILFGGFIWWHSEESGGQIALLIGAILVAFFSGKKPLEGNTSILVRLMGAFVGLSNISKIFGDVLSYLRLFALGLASASLALTFNNLASQAAQSPGMGLLFGLLIFVIGHALNFALSIMSGVVHGLRLNYIEFYNWGLSDEGYPFQSFSKKEDYKSE